MGPVRIQERNQKAGSPLLQNLYCSDKAFKGWDIRQDGLSQWGKIGVCKTLNIGILSKSGHFKD